MRGEGELPCKGYKVCFSREDCERGRLISQENYGKCYDFWKKFLTGSLILMTQMTNEKITKLMDNFDQVWIKNPQFNNL